MNLNIIKSNSHKFLYKVYSLVLLGFIASISSLAQTDSTTSASSKKTRINILGASIIERNPEISEASRLIGNVKLSVDDAILTCDSAYRFDDGRFEVFSNVIIKQEPNTVLTAEYGILKPDLGIVDINGGVVFNHEALSISCPSLIYILDSKHVSYSERANITDGNRNLSSDLGVYSSKTDRLYAGGDVVITELKDTIISDSLSLDRNDKTLRLYKKSHLEINGAFIHCERGQFNASTGKGWFSGDASVMDHQGLLAGDSIIINRNNNEGVAWGNVMISDSTRSMNVSGSYASRTENFDLVTGVFDNLVQIVNIEGADTLRMNTLKLERREEMLFASGEVVFQQDAFSGNGDSLSWDRNKDQMWLLGNPVVWSKEDEMTGDTVRMNLKDNKPLSMQLIGNAHVLSPSNDSLDHVISGRDLFALFTNGKLTSVNVIGNGFVRYYSIDDLEDVNLNTATCSQIQMLFAEGKVSRITLLGLPDGQFTPLNNEEMEMRPVRRIKPQL
jgi:lipopolysaccharide export system protein LptA